MAMENGVCNAWLLLPNLYSIIQEDGGLGDLTNISFINSLTLNFQSLND
jgi:hypothetical protein